MNVGERGIIFKEYENIVLHGFYIKFYTDYFNSLLNGSKTIVKLFMPTSIDILRHL